LQSDNTSTEPNKEGLLHIECILYCNRRDFWNLVELRLNLPPPQQLDQIAVIDSEYLTEEYPIDKLFLRLSGTKQTIEYNGKPVTIRKYYNQALGLGKWISIAKPAPEFIVNMSDLTTRIIAELKILNNPEYVLKLAVARIFENIDFRQCHLSIARKLEVRLDK
jgi:hypothetical protein